MHGKLVSIKCVRDQFAHSINPLDQIKYNSQSLRDQEVRRKFISDAFESTNVLLNLFRTEQIEQIDIPKLKELIFTEQHG